MDRTQTHPSLSDMRDKTDRQLVDLVGREIKHSLNLARRDAFAQAETECFQARTLLGITQAPDWKRREIEAHLDQAGVAIERARSAPTTFMQTVVPLTATLG